jgi:glucose-1-phosphate adenylyltransferase
MAHPHVFAMVLAGGEGKRLAPLTADRAKPAVPFGGDYRLVDFVLSNLVNGGYLKIVVLTQYKSHSLDRHIATTWRMSPLVGNYVTPVPAQMRRGPRWYAGSADAIFSQAPSCARRAAWRPTLSDVPCVASIDCRRPSRKDSWSPQSRQ